MPLLGVFSEDAQLELVGFLGGPGSVPWLLANRAGLPLLNMVCKQRTRLCGLLRPLWSRALLWPLAWRPACAAVAWSSSATSNYAEEALARWRLSVQDEAGAHIVDMLLMGLPFLRLLSAACGDELGVARAASFLEGSSWEVRYFVAGNLSRIGGVLLVFKSGWFEGSLFVADPENSDRALPG